MSHIDHGQGSTVYILVNDIVFNEYSNGFSRIKPIVWLIFLEINLFLTVEFEPFCVKLELRTKSADIAECFKTLSFLIDSELI